MTEIIVWNMRNGMPPADLRTLNVRIDRKSVVGNPYEMHGEGMRDRVCDLYEKYFYDKMKEGGEFAKYIKGIVRDALQTQYTQIYLLCWCAPKRCHGDTIKAYVEAEIKKEESKVIEKIEKFRGDFAWLSNMHGGDVTLDGITYHSGEAAFHAQKSLDPAVRKSFALLSAKDAKKQGRLVEMRNDVDWLTYRVEVMRRVLEAKFAEGSALARKLIATGDAVLIEGNEWNDRFWGVCNGEGKNMLGKLLMERRNQLKSNIIPMTTICFTGHRPNKLGGYDVKTAVNQKILARLKQVIQALLDKYDCITFICGGAIGIDQWAFEICHQLKRDHMVLELAMPFKEQGGAWPQESQDRLQSQIERADRHVLVDELPEYRTVAFTGSYHPAKMQARNEYMVDRADVVIGVWDGSEGGTGNCIRYARHMKKTLAIIHPGSLEVKVEGVMPPRTKGGDA